MSVARPPVTSAHSVEFAALLLARAMISGHSCTGCNAGLRAFGTTLCARCVVAEPNAPLDVCGNELNYEEFAEAVRNSKW